MKNIVLYVFIVLGGMLTGKTVHAQKPVLDLIPVQRQMPHPKTVPDTTGSHVDLPVIGLESDSFHVPAPPLHSEKPEEPEAKRTGLDLHSFFKKRGDEARVRPVLPTGVPLFFKYIHPFQMLFQITAQK